MFDPERSGVCEQRSCCKLWIWRAMQAHDPQVKGMWSWRATRAHDPLVKCLWSCRPTPIKGLRAWPVSQACM